MKYEPMAGEWIEETAERMVELARDTDEQVEAEFNEIALTAGSLTTPEQIVTHYNAETKRRHEEWMKSPERERQQKELAERQRQKDEALRVALVAAPEKMTVRDEGLYRSWWEKNQDGGYGLAVLTYSERWARIMEARIAAGESLEGCAEEASHIADNEGITGFQYGCAVSFLAGCWLHGEALRRWHNLDSQIGNEGERANESGGVLNPALLSIGL